jgi:putative SOS response-associated peptidase YedK
MPCIVKPEDYDEWLDNSHYEIVVLKNILQPIPGNDLETWQVSRDVNSPKNDRESLIEKVKPVPVDPSRPAWETKNST